METAAQRYNELALPLEFYDGVTSALTLPYDLGEDDYTKNAKTLVTPWQSVGAKGVVTGIKADAALLPPQTAFKLR